MARKQRELISERTGAALAAAKARGKALGGDRAYRPSFGPDSGAAAVTRTGRPTRQNTSRQGNGGTGRTLTIFPVSDLS
jgi:DNA invertase Pin-like site-specific DNA recombinase